MDNPTFCFLCLSCTWIFMHVLLRMCVLLDSFVVLLFFFSYAGLLDIDSTYSPSCSCLSSKPTEEKIKEN